MFNFWLIGWESWVIVRHSCDDITWELFGMIVAVGKGGGAKVKFQTVLFTRVLFCLRCVSTSGLAYHLSPRRGAW